MATTLRTLSRDYKYINDRWYYREIFQTTDGTLTTHIIYFKQGIPRENTEAGKNTYYIPAAMTEYNETDILTIPDAIELLSKTDAIKNMKHILVPELDGLNGTWIRGYGFWFNTRDDAKKHHRRVYSRFFVYEARQLKLHKTVHNAITYHKIEAYNLYD